MVFMFVVRFTILVIFSGVIWVSLRCGLVVILIVMRSVATNGGFFIGCVCMKVIGVSLLTRVCNSMLLGFG